MRRSGAAAAGARQPRPRARWCVLAPRLLLAIAPRTPPPVLRDRVLGRLRGRG